MAKTKLEAKLVIKENWMEGKDYVCLMNKWSDEDEWGLDVAFPITDGKISVKLLSHMRHYCEDLHIKIVAWEVD